MGVTNEMSLFISTLLNLPPIWRTRRNHGLEHATLHILTSRFPSHRFAGHSDKKGFWIVGDVSTEDVRLAVDEAYTRLTTGDHHLALHPNCGTNFVAAGILASLGSTIALAGSGNRFRDKLGRLPLVVSIATLAFIFSRPLGLALQEYITTSASPGPLVKIEVSPSQRGRLQLHRVAITDSV